MEKKQDIQIPDEWLFEDEFSEQLIKQSELGTGVYSTERIINTYSDAIKEDTLSGFVVYILGICLRAIICIILGIGIAIAQVFIEMTSFLP